MKKLILLTLFTVLTFSCKKENTEPTISLEYARRVLVSCYPFDGNANDSKGLNNGISSGTSLTSDRNGVSNNAYRFGGKSYVTISTTELINREFSFCAWVKPSQLPSEGTAQFIFSLGGVGGDQSFALNNNYFADTQKRAKWIFGNYTSHEKVSNPCFVEDVVEENKWYFVSAVRSKDSLAVYIDGSLKTKIYSGGQYPYFGTNTQSGKIGCRYTNLQNFVGDLDNVMFFKSTLNAAEIKAIYKAGTCDF